MDCFISEHDGHSHELSTSELMMIDDFPITAPRQRHWNSKGPTVYPTCTSWDPG